MKKLLITLAIIILGISLSGCNNSTTPENNNSDTSGILEEIETVDISEETTTEESTEDANNNSRETIYFASGEENTFLLTNTETGDTEDLIPAGFELVSPYSYDNYPSTLILKKEDNLYTYNLETEEYLSILNSDDLKLNENEGARIYPSRTSDQDFYLYIYETDPNGEMGMGGYPLVNEREYFYSLENNSLSESNFEIHQVGGCIEYDSVNARFLRWYCGEGAGTTLPIVSFDLDGENETELISTADFGLEEDSIEAGAEYNNGQIIAYGKTNLNQIWTIDFSNKELDIKKYVVNESTSSEITSHPYSIIQNPGQKAFIIGTANEVHILNYEDLEINNLTTLAENRGYLNFIFSNKDKLYYDSSAHPGLTIIDLNDPTQTKPLTLKVRSGLFLTKK